jgi:hypothetical protein
MSITDLTKLKIGTAIRVKHEYLSGNNALKDAICVICNHGGILTEVLCLKDRHYYDLFSDRENMAGTITTENSINSMKYARLYLNLFYGFKK